MIPTYRQRTRTRRAVAKVTEYIEGLPGELVELIVVDDGSPAAEKVELGDLPVGSVLLHYPRNLGKGAAVRHGVARASADLILVTDSDLPFALDAIPVTLDWLRDGADLVIGDRHHPESECGIDVSMARRLSSWVFTLAVQRLVGLDYTDTQCGYKGYRAAAAKYLFERLETESFAFDVEILVRATRAGYNVRRQPVRLVNDQDSSVRLRSHALGVALETLRIARRAASGHYG